MQKEFDSVTSTIMILIIFNTLEVFSFCYNNHPDSQSLAATDQFSVPRILTSSESQPDELTLVLFVLVQCTERISTLFGLFEGHCLSSHISLFGEVSTEVIFLFSEDSLSP